MSCLGAQVLDLLLKAGADVNAIGFVGEVKQSVLHLFIRTAEDDGIETYCEGHHPYDLTFWKTVHYDETTGTYMKHHLTNEEVRDNLLPATGNYGAPYIYNNFKWDHCENVGVYFKEV